MNNLTPTTKYFINIGNKKYFYLLSTIDANTSFVECEAANIGQPFQNEDIPALLMDLPNLILAEKEYRKEQDMIRFRVSSEDKRMIEKLASERGYTSVSEFMRHLALTA